MTPNFYNLSEELNASLTEHYVSFKPKNKKGAKVLPLMDKKIAETTVKINLDNMWNGIKKQEPYNKREINRVCQIHGIIRCFYCIKWKTVIYSTLELSFKVCVDVGTALNCFFTLKDSRNKEGYDVYI